MMNQSERDGTFHVKIMPLHGAIDKPEKVKSSKLKKDKKGKEKKKKLKTRTSGTAPSLEDLFTATGGSRLGMRARPIRKGAMKAEVK